MVDDDVVWVVDVEDEDVECIDVLNDKNFASNNLLKMLKYKINKID